MESHQFKYAQLFICIRILTYLLFCDYIKPRDRRGPQQTEGIMRTLQVTESLTESGAQASPSSFAGVDAPVFPGLCAFPFLTLPCQPVHVRNSGSVMLIVVSVPLQPRLQCCYRFQFSIRQMNDNKAKATSLSVYHVLSTDAQCCTNSSPLQPQATGTALSLLETRTLF